MKPLFRFSVEHSLFVNLVSVFILVAGVVCMFALRREAFPNVSYDIVTVRTDYFGAPPEEVEKLVTIEIEDKLKEVNGIDKMTSVSSENISMILIQLDPDEKDKRKIVNDIQRAVDRVDDLPEDIEDPVVEELETKNLPVLSVSLSGNIPEAELQKLAKRFETALMDLPDVANINRIGWRDREIWVEMDPKIANDYKVSLRDVIMALRSQNLNLPAGTLNAERGDFLIRTIGEFENAEEIKEVIVRANDLGNWIKVKDVAEVLDTFEDDDVIEKTYGDTAITLTVIKKEKGDIINLVRDVKKVAADFQKTAPEELRISYFNDFSFYVKRRLDVLTSNGIVGIILVITCLLLTMNRTIALMTSWGIPVAIMATFFFMYAFGLTVNLITMFALIMVLGMIVDDAIIISENVYRHMQMGKDPRTAAIDGTAEVAVPVISTVLTTVVAFIPLLFMSGIIGKYIQAIPFVVIIALCASLFEALIILPCHLADFVKYSPKGEEKEKNPWILKLQAKYQRTLKWVLHHRYKTAAGFLLTFIAAIFLYLFGLRFVLFPEGMIEEFFVRVKAPVGTSLDEMERRMGTIEGIIKGLPPKELDNFLTQIGLTREALDDPNADRGSHIGQFHIFLTPETTKGRRKADEIIKDLRGQAEKYQSLFTEISFEKVRSGPPVGEPVSIRLRGEEFDVLEKASEAVQKKLSEISGVKDIRDDYEIGKTELRIHVDEQKATSAYLTVSDIATGVRNAIEGGVATKIRKTDEEIEVIVRYPEENRTSRSIFQQIEIPNSLGNLIPLVKVAEFKGATGVHAIKHYDRKRMINVTADVDEKKVTPIEVEKKISAFYSDDLSKKFPDVTLSFGGEQEETKKSMRDFSRAILLAAFLIFIILSANFNSILRPLIVMTAIPFGLIGVIFAFILHGQPLSFMALLGVIGLSGVVVNDSIVLVDFIHSLRKQGKDRYESIIQAGGIRLRPVILTTVTTVAGLLPVAYGIGGSDPFLKPMALAIGWGISFATVLTLILVPCLYAISDDVSGWLDKQKEKAMKRWRERPSIKIGPFKI